MAVAIGVLAWSGHVSALPLACAFPALWVFSPTRFMAGIVSMAYFLAASRDLPQSASAYLEVGMIESVGLWFAASASFVLVHTLLWTSKPGWLRAARYGVVSTLMALPPLGITGWASPITAAGVMFPGWGWFGLAATATGQLVMTTRVWPVAALAFGGAWAWSTAPLGPPNMPQRWIGINTGFDYSNMTNANGYLQSFSTITKVKQAASEGHSVIVLPESALGTWTPTTEHLWANTLMGTDVTVLGGAIAPKAEGYDNVIVKVTADGSEVVYRQRMPVPVAMWRPWSPGGATAEFFRNPVAEVNGFRIAPVICAEHLLIWPILQSMINQPDVVVAIGNGWWAQGTDVVANQVAQVQAWTALFDTKFVHSFNKLDSDWN